MKNSFPYTIQTDNTTHAQPGLCFFDMKGSQIKPIEKDDELWFVVKDVADVLGFPDANQITRWLDYNEQTTLLKVWGRCKIKGLRKDTRLVTESGFYSLIFQSNKPEAKQFRRWVTHEVLPSIRKYGTYMTPEKIEEVLDDPDTMIELAQQVKARRQQAATTSRPMTTQEIIAEPRKAIELLKQYEATQAQHEAQRQQNYVAALRQLANEVELNKANSPFHNVQTVLTRS